MNRRETRPLEMAGHITERLDHGILLNSQANGRFNSMVIAWGHIGIEWGKPIFVCYVREGRFTRPLIDEAGAFTVSVPTERLSPRVMHVCGAMSGRDVDKVAEAGLTLVEPVANGVPAIAEAPITLECKVIYRRPQDLSLVPADVIDRYYPEDVPSEDCGSNADRHVAYYGEIVASYVLEG